MAGSGKAASRLGVDRRRRDVRDSHGLSSRLKRADDLAFADTRLHCGDDQ